MRYFPCFSSAQSPAGQNRQTSCRDTEFTTEGTESTESTEEKA